MLRSRARSVAFVLALGVMAAAADAHAQTNEGGSAAAESLFQEARKLMDAKRFSEACPKLAASQKIAPAVGTLLNLADCYERAGQLASAWARFHEAIALAQRLGRADREKTAKERADKLEPRLIKLTIVSQESGVEVKLDGNVLEAAALTSGHPVDPGKHVIEASAKGKKAFTTTVDVSDKTKSPSVEIPTLEADSEAAGKTVTPPTDPRVGEDKGQSGSTQRIAGLAVMGVGVVGVAVGTIFGLRTSSIWSEAKTHCTGIDCDRTGVQLAAEAKNAGTVSTISFIVSAALLGGGAAIFFTAPKSPPKTGTNRPKIDVGLGSVMIRGTF